VAELAAVQRQREWPVRIIQAYQQVMQGWILATRGAGEVPLGFRLQQRVPFLRELGTRILSLGTCRVRLNPASDGDQDLSPTPMRL
jgi:hypothetical protein